jgi:hypothetical protein
MKVRLHRYRPILQNGFIITNHDITIPGRLSTVFYVTIRTGRPRAGAATAMILIYYGKRR